MSERDPLQTIRDPERLRAVRQTGLLDTPAEESFDRLTRLAVRLVGVPVAFVSLVDADRDFYKSQCGFGEPLSTLRELQGTTFCHYAIASEGALVIPDTRADPVFREVPTVESLGVAAYAGIPIRDAFGHALGSFCAIDFQPRSWTAGDIEVLSELAHSAEREIELRRAARELEAAAASAEEANVAKSRFLTNMSHEIRTPINAILGYTELLDVGVAGGLSEGQKGYVDRIMMSGRHLVGLVNEVLDLAKIEAGELVVLAESRPVRATVETALSMIAPQAASKGIETVIEDATRRSNDQYTGDADRVRQILVNLLSNAVKFTDPGGRLVLRSCVRIGEGPEGAPPGVAPWMTIEVEDSGIGIPEGDLDRVFEPFMQVDATNTRRQGGTGLGLTISRKLARAMGGDLTLRSTPGEGSCFTLWLPMRPDAGERPAAHGRREARIE